VNWRRLIGIACYFLAFFTGLVSAKIIHGWGMFAWDHKVNPVELASFILTAWISVAFFAVFERQKYSDKLRKDALLERLKTCGVSLLTLDEMCEETALEYDRVVRTIKKFRGEFHVFMQFAAAAKWPIAEKDRNDFNKAASAIHVLLTGTPRRIVGVSPLESAPLTKDGKNLLLSPERQVEVKNKINREKQCLDGIETGIILKI
jgi:hypothetical protein